MDDTYPEIIVIHYHEIALKGDNRPMFVRRLVNNIRLATGDLGLSRVLTPRGRILLQLKEKISWSILNERLSGVFGIANYAPAFRCPPLPEAMEQLINRLLESRQFESFRIAARRADKHYPMTSMEMNARFGRKVQELKPVRVDLENPELTIHVEVLDREALIYLEKKTGAGGLPVGVSGHLLSLISGGIDSPVASYYMMKRGCTLAFIHFHSHPLQSKASQEKVEDLVQHLTRHQNHSRLYMVAFGEIQQKIVLTVPPPYRVVLYRRLMMRIAEETAALEQARGLVTGESLGQVASQTLENLTVIQATTDLPLLRPLIGLDKEEITRKARQIGTFETSIIPDQDCCRLFIPAHPAVRTKLNEIEKTEQDLDIPGLVQMGIKSTVRMEFTSP